MDNYVRNAVKEEINRASPPPKTARVVSIGDKYCEVTYTGESTVVKVPYNNLAPSYEGQVVLIDGPAGDRRIVEVMGRTSIESRIESAEEFNFAPPLWYTSLMEDAEVYPVLMTNNSRMMEQGNTFVSPAVVPRDMAIVRLETRLLNPKSATLKMSLYRCTDNFTLHHIESVSTPANSRVIGVNLSQPYYAVRGEMIGIGISATWGGDNRPDVVAMLHPNILASRENQFSIARFSSNLQEGTIQPDPSIRDTWFDMHMWAAGLTYIPD